MSLERSGQSHALGQRAHHAGCQADVGSIAIIIVNWRSWREVLAGIQSLRRSRGAPKWRVFVVDNASGDESVARLAVVGGDVSLVQSSVNGGWAAGVNIGIKAATNAGYQNFLLFNPDATVREDTLAQLARAQQEVAAPCALGCLVRFAATGAIQFAGADEDSRTGLPVWRDEGDLQGGRQPQLSPSDSLFGAAMLVTSQALELAGSISETFFLNYEETDWCARARAAGVSLYVATHAVVDHVGNATIGGHDSPRQTYYMARNELLFSRLNGTPSQRVMVWLNLLRTFLVRSGLIGVLKGRPFKPQPLKQQAAFVHGLADHILRRYGAAPPAIARLHASPQRPKVARS